jgi:hypothetical protein
VLLDTNLMGRVAVRDKPDHADGLRRRRRRIRLHLQHRPMVRRRAV